jgi:cellulose biosynthesis protein BcsQ
MNIIAFFNNKGGVGKTSLVYHLAWMFSDLGLRVLAADLDPQANLSSMFLQESDLEDFWPDGEHPRTVLGAVRPIIRGLGDLADVRAEQIDRQIALVVGDLGLSVFEDKLSASWPLCSNRDESAFRVVSSFYRLILRAAEDSRSDLVLVDVGPNLGAINRAVLIATTHVVIPLAPDLFSMQGLRNLGPTLRQWREEWAERLPKNPATDLPLPPAEFQPAGYIFMQHFARASQPVKAYDKWMQRMPAEYRSAVLDQPAGGPLRVEDDPNCLGTLKHYRSLMPMAMDARKPMFRLKPADGAIGAHTYAVQECAKDFERLARRIAQTCGVSLPDRLSRSPVQQQLLPS